MVEVATDTAVLNADDELCLKMADYTEAKHLCYVTMNPRHPLVREHIRAGARAVVLEEGLNGQQIVLYDNGRHIPLLWTHLIPATMEGRALHNVQNAMVATAVAYSLGKKLEDIRHGLRTFDTSFFQAPGRMNVFNEHPFKVILDYGHNPAAVRAMCQLVERTPVRGRRLVALTMPGDRRDEDIAEVAKIAAGAQFDHYVCQARRQSARPQAGRGAAGCSRPGLLANGVEADQITIIPDEQEAVQAVLEMAEPNDLVLIFADNVTRCWKQIIYFGRDPSAVAAATLGRRPSRCRRTICRRSRIWASCREGAHADPRRARRAPRPRPRGSRLAAAMSEPPPRVTWRDSRRLTGPNLLLDGPGAVLEAHLRRRAARTSWSTRWRAQAGRHAGGGRLARRHRWRRAASLAAPASPSARRWTALYAATLVNEWACEAAAASLPAPPCRRWTAPPPRSEREIAARARPGAAGAGRRGGTAWRRLRRGRSAGLGRPGRGRAGLARRRAARRPRPVDWAAVRDVPVILVTGTNGKSTTVRLIAAMARAAGKVAGLSSSDWVRVGDEILDRGDYSGPGGARLALRDRRVEIAVLELARGGILRRGLPRHPRRRRHRHQRRRRSSGRVRHPRRRRHRRRQARRRQGAAPWRPPDPQRRRPAPGRARPAARRTALSWFSHGPGPSIRDGAALEDGLIVLRQGGRLDPGPARRRGPHRHGRRRPPQPRQRAGRHRRCRRPGPARRRHGRGAAQLRRRRGRQSRPRRAARDRRRQGAGRLRPQSPRRRRHRRSRRHHPGARAAWSCWARPATAPTPRSGPWPPPSGRCGPTGSSSRRWRATCAAGEPGEIPALLRAELARLGAAAATDHGRGQRDRRRPQRLRLGAGRATCWCC